MMSVPRPGLGAFAAGTRMLHTMLRVRDLQRSLDFYVGILGMRVLRRREDVPGQYTLLFVGYEDESQGAVLELTHNWDGRDYALGTAYGHVALGVDDLQQAVQALAGAGVPITRPPGPLAGDPGEQIAFIEDPDGYRIELIARRRVT